MDKQARLRRMLAPTKVVWVGGAGMVPAMEYMFANGFTGQVAVVNPKRDQLAGIDCVAKVESLPWVPDLAILVIPKEHVLTTVASLSALGCGGVICITSGFSETADGADREQELIAAAADMPVIGPNCPGMANFLDHSAFMMDHFGDHGQSQLGKGVAVISNGGAYLSDLGCANRSQPIAYLIGLGNQSMVSVADMLEVVVEDPRVTAVNIYFESITDVAALSRAAMRAAERQVPVVVIKGGRSSAGQRAAMSHTASMAGDAVVASSLFERFGWLEVKTIAEAIETVKMLSYTSIPKGKQIGFITSSGSYAVLGGDLAEAQGLQMPLPSGEGQPAINKALPDYVSAANPLDISDAHGWPQADQEAIYRAFVKDDYDALVQVMCYPPEGGWDMSTWDATTSALAAVKGQTPTVFVNTLAESLPVTARQRMIAAGVAPLQGLQEGLVAVAKAAQFGSQLGLDNAASSMAMPTMVMPSGLIQVLSEGAAKKWLQQQGVLVPQSWQLALTAELPEADINYVLKAQVPGLLHKTEVGAVQLNLKQSDLAQAREQMLQVLAQQGYQAESLLLEEMLPSALAELMVTVRRVESVGLVLNIAMGGTGVELIDDMQTLILPAEKAAIMASIDKLRLAPMLRGYRGRPQANIEQLVDAIDAIVQAVTADTSILELEINPLMVSEQQTVVADAVLRKINTEE